MIGDMRPVPRRILHHTKCLETLPYYFDNVFVEFNHEKIINKLKFPLLQLADRNGRKDNFFLVDDQLFMNYDTDRPEFEAAEWINFYQDMGVKAFFLLMNRPDFTERFSKLGLKVPLFTLPSSISHSVPYYLFDQGGHAKSAMTPKDISVFFCGKYKHQFEHRKIWADKIKEEIPNSMILDTVSEGLSPVDLLNNMSRAKIIWCPGSVTSGDYPNQYTISPRDIEAMALEAMVIRTPISVIEDNPRQPGIHYVEVAPDNSDLLEKINYYLEHEEERLMIAQNGYHYYELNCTPFARGMNVLMKCISTFA